MGVPRLFLLNLPPFLGWSWYHLVPSERSSVSMIALRGSRTRPRNSAPKKRSSLSTETTSSSATSPTTDEEPELLVPHGAEAPLHHRGRPRAAPPQLQPHVGIAGAVEVDRRQAPRLHHVHAQQHRRVVVAGLRATGRTRRRRPRHLWGLARRDERVRRCSVRTGEIEQWRAICGLHGIGDSDEAKGGGLPAAV